MIQMIVEIIQCIRFFLLRKIARMGQRIKDLYETIPSLLVTHRLNKLMNIGLELSANSLESFIHNVE